MTAGTTRGTVGGLGGSGIILATVFMLAGPAAGESYWAGRARQVAAIRLASAGSDAGETVASQGPPLNPPLLAGRKNTGGAKRAVAVPWFRLVAAPETGPASEVPAGEGREITAERAACEIQRGPLPGFFETLGRDLREAPKVLWHDTKAVYGNPWNDLFLVGAGGVAIALRPEADDDIEDRFRYHHSLGRDERNTFDVLGNPGMTFAYAGLMYVAGQTLQEAKTYEVGKRAFSALIITDLNTLLLKLICDTKSPNGERFAFPSGHVSSTMAFATVLNEAYGPVVGVPAYGFTVLAALERIDDREHMFSDVIFGAALGWVVAEQVMKEHQPEVFGGQIVPYLDPERASAGVAWIKALGN